MLLESLVGTRRAVLWGPWIVAAVLATTACGMAGFGGSLQLNITDKQSRQVVVSVDGGSADARLLEIDASGEVEIGTGTASIERYVVQRATFGNGVAVGYFLCPRPCTDPLTSYVVAYSPDQIFAPDGALELRFRVESGAGTEEMTRRVNAEMLPALWQTPKIDAKAGGS